MFRNTINAARKLGNKTAAVLAGSVASGSALANAEVITAVEAGGVSATAVATAVLLVLAAIFAIMIIRRCIK